VLKAQINIAFYRNPSSGVLRPLAGDIVPECLCHRNSPAGPFPCEIGALKKVLDFVNTFADIKAMSKDLGMKKVSQFWFRLAPKEKKLIEKAAEIDRRSVSDFIRLAAIDRAKEVISTMKKGKEGS
jgi:hypothetical protein